ncbi:MAG TPA: hypothetical protein VMK82_00380 [Steroidobacteraceae bacterium]|nr:hypothetical protein [Steroidobacteraceae bacterium]
MGRDADLPDQQPELKDTARIDRRRTILAQVEAALLADKLSLDEVKKKAKGTDPYNKGAPLKLSDSTGVWRVKRPG